MYELIAKGGPLMLPILTGLLVGLAIIIERGFNLPRFTSSGPKDVRGREEQPLQQGL